MYGLRPPKPRALNRAIPHLWLFWLGPFISAVKKLTKTDPFTVKEAGQEGTAPGSIVITLHCVTQKQSIMGP